MSLPFDPSDVVSVLIKGDGAWRNIRKGTLCIFESDDDGRWFHFRWEGGAMRGPLTSIMAYRLDAEAPEALPATPPQTISRAGN
ncbi:MAG: hypothetical protein V3W41_22070 [Planctomycetota bacterium]